MEHAFIASCNLWSKHVLEVIFSCIQTIATQSDKQFSTFHIAIVF